MSELYYAEYTTIIIDDIRDFILYSCREVVYVVCRYIGVYVYNVSLWFSGGMAGNDRREIYAISGFIVVACRYMCLFPSDNHLLPPKIQKGRSDDFEKKEILKYNIILRLRKAYQKLL